MVSFPHCKINLGLHVVSKRDDGFHNIETCFYPIPWCDVLEIIPSETISFTNTGLSIPGQPEENLCLKAYYLLRDDFDLPPINMHLHKIVPMGAGLGGGSSDGAHVLMMLNDIFELQLSSYQLATYSNRLGSDCTFFLRRGAMLGTGRGEILSPISISLKGKFIVVVKPEVHISTQEAYQGIKPAIPDLSLSTILTNHGILDWQHLLHNDFERVVFNRYPLVGKIKEQLYVEGAMYASMSGSGSSVFGIFENPIELKNKFQEQVYWSGSL